MAVDEYSLLHGLDLELPVQIDNSVEQDFLLLEKKNFTLQQLMLFMSMKNLSRTRVKKKKSSGPRL